ncbi:hypothetical protein SAY87_016031 [Trapa incisa]|nr:hypothetical protein SAY87_016031 [Trapa incisa]
MARTGLLDLEKHFAFYGAYHSNPINVLIHMLLVWPIVFTTLLILYFTPSLFGFHPVEFSLFGSHVILLLNVGFLLTVIYAIFYVCFDVKAGTLAALLCVACWIGSSFVANRLGFSLTWKVVLIAQVLCWTGQFIGHGVFERRAPALLDNLAQAFLMAPFFVLLEALHKFLGYEPYPGFHERVQAKIESDAVSWQDKKKKLLP